MPDRPRPLLEIGDPFLGRGEVQKGFELPTGAVWSPSFLVFGQFRSAIQTFDDGAVRISEWANRLDLFGNLQLSPTERILAGFRPLDRGDHFSGYQFEPRGRRGWDDGLDASMQTLFFEGELGEVFPRLDPEDRRGADYGISLGRQPLLLQDGLLVNDDRMDLLGITRNALLPPPSSHLKLSGLFGWNDVERRDGRTDDDAWLFGISSFADFAKITLETDVLYVTADRGGDGLFLGLGSVQRLGFLNTTFRVNHSVATEQEDSRIRNGTLLFTELSYTPRNSENLVYLNGFWGLDEFTSASRSPTAGGPLGRVGILFAAVGLGRYGSPLNSHVDHATGGALGYQFYFDELRRRQLTTEIGGFHPTNGRGHPTTGAGLRFQQAFGRRFVWIVDTFGALQRDRAEAFGVRTELLIKF